jgi:hypothetical protein
MKKILITVLAVVMLAGCATWGKVCEQGPEIKARIRSALQIAQVSYPLVAALANQTPNPNVLAKVGLIDAAIDILGKLAYDIACPTVKELNTAQTALEKAQAAKADLGVK